MSGWNAKRFWSEVSVHKTQGGFEVHLDSRRLNTPGKLPLILPNRPLAEAIAAEWAAQEDQIQPLTMPFTRSANSALERVTPQHAAVADMLASYGETDLLCYRAEAPEELAKRQAAAWDPVLEWAADALGARLLVGTGILPVTQSPATLERLKAEVHATRPFPLTALHDLITLSGSLVLGLAVARGQISAQTAFDLSRIDEEWQIEQWGEDAEARDAANTKRAQFLHADAFWRATA